MLSNMGFVIMVYGRVKGSSLKTLLSLNLCVFWYASVSEEKKQTDGRRCEKAENCAALSPAFECF